MSKRLLWKGIADETKHATLHRLCKKYGRSHGPLVMGLNGVMVTPKVLRAQKTRKGIE